MCKICLPRGNYSRCPVVCGFLFSFGLCLLGCTPFVVFRVGSEHLHLSIPSLQQGQAEFLWGALQ